MDLGIFNELVKTQNVFYSIEIYPPEYYDSNTYLIKPSEFNYLSDISEPDDLINILEPETDIESEEQDNSEIEFETNIEFETKINYGTDIELEKHDDRPKTKNLKERKKIVEYIKKKEFPLYRYSQWSTLYSDMINISNEFEGWIFIIFERPELFTDRTFVKIFRNGCTIHASNNIETNMKLCLPNGSHRTIYKNGSIESNGKFDIRTELLDQSNEKGLSDIAHVGMDMFVIAGRTIADLGSLASEAAVAAKVLAVGVAILDELHQDLIQYSENKGKCYFLYNRCQNIINMLQQMDSGSMSLTSVRLVVETINEAKDLIKKYKRQWCIMKFLSAKSNQRKFDSVHSNLDSGIGDLSFGYSLQHKKKL